MPIQTVGVVGCGLMGSGIAQVAAQAGHAVIVREVNAATRRKGSAVDREESGAAGYQRHAEPG